MTVGVEPCQADLFKGTGFVGDRVGQRSVFSLLAREGCRLFGDGMFDDLFSSRGRRSVPPRVVATVMVLQRWFGLSDREAVEAFEFDARWRYACGCLDVDGGGFSHTVLVGMRARLAASDQPRRVFDVVLDAARSAGALSPRRVLDSAPVYDAVATQDTVTMLHNTIRKVLTAADAAGCGETLRRVLRCAGDYVLVGKPSCDWEDPTARDALVDNLATDGYAVLDAMAGRVLNTDEATAAELLAAVLGQDIEVGPDKTMRIACRVAKNRVISTVDPDARHGRKSSAGGFDGYKGHIAVDPDSELITDTAVTAGNAADTSTAKQLIKDLTNTTNTAGAEDTNTTDIDTTDIDTAEVDDINTTDTADAADSDTTEIDDSDTTDIDTTEVDDSDTTDSDATDSDAADAGVVGGGFVDEFEGRPVVYGDSGYGSGEFQQFLHDERINSRCRTQPPANRGGFYSKDRFDVDVEAATVTCPAGVSVVIRSNRDNSGVAFFGAACETCVQRSRCTAAKAGRTVRVSRHETVLADARGRSQNPAWKRDYQATRPKVERRLAHLKRRWHGGRRARVRGRPKVDADFNLLAAAHNIARLAALGLHHKPTHWALA